MEVFYKKNGGKGMGAKPKSLKIHHKFIIGAFKFT